MIGFANAALLGSLVVAATPILLHIAHRRRFTRISWAGMRFLVDLLQAHRKRLQLENWLLLATRVLALACLGLALARPYWRGADSTTGIERRGGVAAVLLIDDSVSTAAGRGEPAFAAMRRLAEDYLATLRRGDEISIIPLSRLGEPHADPLFDADVARAVVGSLAPTAVASDLPAMIDVGIDQLSRHINPSAELVIVSDGMADGWQADDLARWEDLHGRLAAMDGGRPAPRIILLSPEVAASGANLTVADLTLDRALVPEGRQVGIRVRVVYHGDGVSENVVLRLGIDGRPVDQRSLILEAGDDREEMFSHVFTAAGSHLVEAWIDGGRDVLPADDRRTRAVDVESEVSVLLVEGESGTGLDGSLGYVAAALDPDQGRGLFATRRMSAARLDAESIGASRVVVLGDVSALEPSTVAALESFLVAGGGVLVGVGPRTNAALANRFWARSGHGFLPVTLGTVLDRGTGARPVLAGAHHPALVPVATGGDQVWLQSRIRRLFAIDRQEGDGLEVLMHLTDGTPLVVTAERGHGAVALFTTTLGDAWNDLPHHAAFVPLVRGLVADLGSVVLPPRNLRPGDRFVWLPAGDLPGPVTIEAPDGSPLPARSGAWEGRRGLISDAARIQGGYVLRGAGAVVRFAVALDARESGFQRLPSEALGRLIGGDPIVLHSSDAIATCFAPGGRRAVELWPVLIVASLGFLFAETLLTRREAMAGQVTPPAGRTT